MSSSAITLAQLAPAVYAGSGAAATLARSDHTHDERYYTEAETATLLDAKANRFEIVVATDGFGSWAFVPEQTLFTMPVTTANAGRWMVRLNAGVGATCAPNALASRILFLLVDGAAISSSVVTMPETGPFTGVLFGVSPSVIPAGFHTVSVGVECSSTDTALLTAIYNPRSATIVVMP